MAFPNANEIESILNELKDAEPTLVIDYKEASYSDVLKYKLCQEFVKLLKEEKISQAELSRRLGVDKAVVNKIILHRIEHFTIDRLVDLYSSLRPLSIKLEAS